MSAWAFLAGSAGAEGGRPAAREGSAAGPAPGGTHVELLLAPYVHIPDAAVPAARWARGCSVASFQWKGLTKNRGGKYGQPL